MNRPCAPLRSTFVVGGLLCMLLSACAQPPVLSSPSSAIAATADAFVGRWAYVQSCGRQHSAELELVAASGGGIAGSWNDGTRVAGDDGELRGTLVGDGRLAVAFCSTGAQAGGRRVCPQFGPVDGYLARERDVLGWYRRQGDTHTRYLTLHRVIAGTEIPTDDDCPEE
jgi:hypothetical protein